MSWIIVSMNFSYQTTRSVPEELDYRRIDEYIRSVQAFSRSSFSGRTFYMYRQIRCSCAGCRRSE